MPIQRKAKEPVVIPDTEYERLDNLLKYVWPSCMSGDVRAITAALNIIIKQSNFVNQNSGEYERLIIGLPEKKEGT